MKKDLGFNLHLIDDYQSTNENKEREEEVEEETQINNYQDIYNNNYNIEEAPKSIEDIVLKAPPSSTPSSVPSLFDSNEELFPGEPSSLFHHNENNEENISNNNDEKNDNDNDNEGGKEVVVDDNEGEDKQQINDVNEEIETNVNEISKEIEQIEQTSEGENLIEKEVLFEETHENGEENNNDNKDKNNKEDIKEDNNNNNNNEDNINNNNSEDKTNDHVEEIKEEEKKDEENEEKEIVKEQSVDDDLQLHENKVEENNKEEHLANEPEINNENVQTNDNNNDNDNKVEEEEEEEEGEEEGDISEIINQLGDFYYPILYLKKQKLNLESANSISNIVIVFTINEEKKWNFVIKIDKENENEIKIAILRKNIKNSSVNYSLSRSNLLQILTENQSIDTLINQSDISILNHPENSSLFSSLFQIKKEQYQEWKDEIDRPWKDDAKKSELKIAFLFASKIAFHGNSLATSVSFDLIDLPHIPISAEISSHFAVFNFEKSQTKFNIKLKSETLLDILQAKLQFASAFKEKLIEVDDVAEFLIFVSAFHFVSDEFSLFHSKWNSFQSISAPRSPFPSSPARKLIEKSNSDQLINEENNNNSDVDSEDIDGDIDSNYLMIKSKFRGAFIEGNDQFAQFLLFVTKDSANSLVILLNIDRDNLSIRLVDPSYRSFLFRFIII